MMVRERYSKVRMNYTNIATKIIQSVSRCYELTVSDSSSAGRTPTAVMVAEGGHRFKSCLSDGNMLLFTDGILNNQIICPRKNTSYDAGGR